MGTANDYTHTEGEGKSITYNSSIQSTIGQQKIKGQSTKSDTIYRADAIKAIEDMQDCYNGFSGTYDKAQIIGVLEEVPTAEPKWKRGKWINDRGLYKCSCCNRLWAEWWVISKPIERMRKEMPYCPMCGSYNGEEN